jgi:hypothetical protein
MKKKKTTDLHKMLRPQIFTHLFQKNVALALHGTLEAIWLSLQVYPVDH